MSASPHSSDRSSFRYIADLGPVVMVLCSN
jgi:hypothetical protein